MKKKYTIVFVISIIMLGVLGYSLKKIFFTVPDLFPLQDMNATYTITKDCPVHEKAPDDYQKGYCVEYKGNRLLVDNDTHSQKVLVGSSKQDLTPYIDKKISINKGYFTNGNKQCIKDRCTYFTNSVVINLTAISLH